MVGLAASRDDAERIAAALRVRAAEVAVYAVSVTSAAEVDRLVGSA